LGIEVAQGLEGSREDHETTGIHAKAVYHHLRHVRRALQTPIGSEDSGVERGILSFVRYAEYARGLRDDYDVFVDVNDVEIVFGYVDGQFVLLHHLSHLLLIFGDNV